MKGIRSLVYLFVCLAVSGVSIAGTIDLKPIGLSFKKGLDDDISMHYSQHVYIKIKNVGTEDYTAARGYRIKFKMNGSTRTGYIYGPDHDGGSLGGRIEPGEVGKIFFRLPLNTLARCAQTKIHIDSNRRVQRGGWRVFRNDKKVFLAHDRDSRFRCMRRISIPRLPRVLEPLNNLILDE
ncbi:MAG: hypothetical protein ISR65_14605 [Bacteriovoracaceae bacterium]|nr:hypothetical protein [Bacteriovoracaceae bacterium]